MIAIGVIVYALRNTPNPYAGVRIGYTYLSKEAWRKANTFAGIYCIIVGLILLAVTLIFNPSRELFLALLLVLTIILTIKSYRIAKETYEREDMRTPLKNSTKPIEETIVKPYLIAQIIPIIFYIILIILFWENIPDAVAIHFDVSGKPDNYVDKFTGAVLIPLFVMAIIPVLTLLTIREPMLLRSPIHGIKQRNLFTLLTSVQTFIVLIETLVLLYNIGLVPGKWITWLAIGFIISLLVWISLIWYTHKIPSKFD
jgi:uncharacterized membrane protein